MPNATSFESLKRLHEFINSGFIAQNGSPELNRFIQTNGAEFVQIYMDWMSQPKPKTKKYQAVEEFVPNDNLSPTSDNQETDHPHQDTEHHDQDQHQEPNLPVYGPANLDEQPSEVVTQGNTDARPLSPWPEPSNDEEEVALQVIKSAPRKAGRPKSAPKKLGFIRINRGTGPERKPMWLEAFTGSGGRSYYIGPSGNKQYISDTSRIVVAIPLTEAENLGEQSV